MRMDRLTLRVQDIINSARNIAAENNSAEIHPEHILKAAIYQEGGIFNAIAEKLGASVNEIKNELNRYIESMPKQTGGSLADALSAKAREMLSEAWNSTVQLGDQYLSTEHLLIALSTSDSSKARHILNSHGFNKESILRVIMDIRHNKKADDENAETGQQSTGIEESAETPDVISDVIVEPGQINSEDHHSLLADLEEHFQGNESLDGLIIDIPAELQDEESKGLNKIRTMTSHFAMLRLLSPGRILLLFPQSYDRELIAHRLSQSLKAQVLLTLMQKITAKPWS